MATGGLGIEGLLVLDPDQSFTTGAPRLPRKAEDPDQDALYRCLLNAQGRCGEDNPISNEDYDATLRFLREVNLIVDQGESPTAQVARYIIDHVSGARKEMGSNFSITVPSQSQQHPPIPLTATSTATADSTNAPPRKLKKHTPSQPFATTDPSPLLPSITLTNHTAATITTSSQTIDIPRKSRFVLRLISKQLGIRIVVFSTRKKTKIYDNPDLAHPYATTVVLLHIKSSYEGLGQFVALKAVPPLSENVRTLSSSGQVRPAPPESSRFLKHDPTSSPKRVRPTRKETEQLQNVIKPEQGYNIFQNTCWSYLHTAVEDKVRGIMLPSVKKAPNSGKKCKGKKAKKEADMDKARRDFRTKLMGARKLPDGLRKQTIDAIQNYYQNNNLTDYNVQKALNPTKTELLHRFHKMVDMSIEELWDLAILDMQEELAGVVRGTAEPEGLKDEELRVCSTTLAQVIRKEFSERDVAAVEEKLVEKRDVLSDYTQEICALALQATVLIAQGILHDETRVFEIDSVFPEGFQVRDAKMAQDDSLMDIKAGVITPETQERFVDLKKFGRNRPDEVCLLNQDHLSNISTNILGTKSKAYKLKHPPRKQSKGATLKDGDDHDATGHPGWRTILSAMESILGPGHLDKSTTGSSTILKRKRPDCAPNSDHDPDETKGKHKSVDDVDYSSELESTDVMEDAAEALFMDIDWSYIASDGQPGSSHWNDNIGCGVEEGISNGSRSTGSEDGEEFEASVKRDVYELPIIPKNLSQTCAEMIREVAKDIDNLWSGAIYIKLLDYTLRILLRLHLAPRRERAHYERCRAKAIQKADEARSTDQRHTIGYKTWLSRMTALFDDLDQALDFTDAAKLERKVKTVLGLIAEHNLYKPALVERVSDLDTLDVRIVKAQLDKIDEGVVESQPDKTDTISEAYDDDEDSDDEEFQDEEIDAAPGKEPSRRHLKALQTVTRRVLQDPDPNLDTAVTAETIRERAYDKSIFSEMEYETAAKIVNALRPFVAKNQVVTAGEPGSHHPPRFVMLLAPFAMIANSILRAAGYHKFTRRICPIPSATSTHPLPLNATAIYEVLASSGKGHFDVLEPGSSGRTIKSVQQARDIAGGEAMFAAFFDMEKIHRVCQDHGLAFANRITFIDKYTLRIMGSVLPNGPTNPQRRPTASLYDSKRKKKSRDPAGISWSSELHARGLTIADAKDQTAIWSEKVEKLEPEIKDLKKTVSKLEKERSSALVEHRKHDNRNTRSTYGVVQGIRHSLTESRKELGPKEEELRVARRSLYYWNKLTSTTPAKNPSSPPEDTLTSRPSLASPAMQDFVEATCIKEVLDSASDSNHAVSYAGTDRGLKMMHLTVPQSRPDLDAHLNRYSALYNDWETVLGGADDTTHTNNNDKNNNTQEAEPPPTPQQRQKALLKIKKPKANTISAKQIQATSFGRKTAKKRERRLKKSMNQDVRDIHGELANKTMEHAQTIGDVKEAQDYRRGVRHRLREFETSNARTKDQHTQDLRTTRAWALFSAKERKVVQEHGRRSALSMEDVKDTGVATATVREVDGWCSDCEAYHLPEMSPQGLTYVGVVCPKTRPKITPVLFVGTGGLCIGARLGGNLKLGGGRITDQHRQSCPVLMTNEMRTSKVCIFCYHQLQLAKARRIINGSVKTVRVHGAVECVNNDCEAVQCGHTIRGRDDNAAVAIAIAGYSNLVSRDRLTSGVRRTLPPFEPRLIPKIATPTPSTSESTGTIIDSEGISSGASSRCPQGPGQ
ncbi:hypothetical protein BKA57DRAFT_541270 [Linnemannia elongata]|nr:hypothetical protein BKA57DRAFT_541270 [Linnemannia elongata]